MCFQQNEMWHMKSDFVNFIQMIKGSMIKAVDYNNFVTKLKFSLI